MYEELSSIYATVIALNYLQKSSQEIKKIPSSLFGLYPILFLSAYDT